MEPHLRTFAAWTSGPCTFALFAVVAMLGACGDSSSGADTTAEVDTTTEVVDTADVPDTTDTTTDTTPPFDLVDSDTTPDAEVADADPNDTDADPADSDVAPEDTTSDTLADAALPRCGDGTTDPDEACDDGDLDDLDGCTRDCELGPIVRPPTQGEVIITELMVAPGRVGDLQGEWFELTSLADETLNLSGCAFLDDGTDRIDLALGLDDLDLSNGAGGLTIHSRELLVFGLNPNPATNGGVAVDVPYTTMLLEDLADELVLVCDDTIIDRLAWTPFTWPIIEGRSLSLDPTRRNVDDNDLVDSWCSGLTRFGAGDRGSPGADNPSCPHLDRDIDACRLLGAPSLAAFRNAPIPVGLEVEELGLTDLTPGVDLSPQLVVEIGVGALPSPPLIASSFDDFTFRRALPEPGYAAPVGVRSDRWSGPALGGSVGTLAIVGRASRDAGATWRYCDRDGSLNGLAADQLTGLVVAETPCAPTSCLTPPAASCAADDLTLIGSTSPGRCDPVDAATFTCAYDAELTDCGRLGRACEAAPDPVDPESPTSGATCSGIPTTPEVGELVFSELMLTPTASIDAATGQWVELTNVGDSPRLLTGCVLTHTPFAGEVESLVIDEPLVIAARSPDGTSGQVVLGASTDPLVNGGADVDFAWGEAITLTSIGELTLTCDEDLDTILWNATWPLASGTAVSLSPFRLTPDTNDAADGWCRAETSFGAGDRGTPGAPNPNCPGDLVPVESCRIGGPAVVTPPAGTEDEVPLRVVVRSLTGRTPRTDPSPRLWLEVGIVPRGAAASTIDTWRRAKADTTWVSTGQGVDPAEDRYRGPFKVPPVGLWDLYLRATADGGNSYSLCDLDGIISDSNGTAARPLAVEPTPSACDPDPCATPPGPVCQPATSGAPTVIIGRSGPATCTLGDAEPTCAFIDTPIEDCALRGATCLEAPDDGIARCDGFPRTPVAGDLVFSELMIAPVVAGVPNELGEWLELTNVTDLVASPSPLDLRNCSLRSGDETWALGTPSSLLGYVVKPGEAITFARSATASINGQSQPAGIWSGLALGNAVDTIALECDGVTITTLTWDAGQGWPVTSGQSMQLSGALLDLQDTSTPSYWCSPAPASPGVKNLVCPGDGVIDDCRVIADDLTASADDLLAFAVLIQDLGVTDLRPVTDAATGVIVEVGLGAFDTNPRTSLKWTWYPATPDPMWDDLTGTGDGEPDVWLGWDGWQAELQAQRPADLFVPVAPVAPVVGPGSGVGTDLAVLARVSHDGGRTFRLCGLDGFSDDPDSGATIDLTAGVCAPNPCRTPQASTCSGTTLIGYTSPGVCTAVDGEASCTYATRTFSCFSYGGCNAAAATCTTPPASPSTPGALVITEVMRDSSLPLPDRGEWVEVRNAGSSPLDLRGCVFSVATGQPGQSGQAIAGAPITGPVPELISAGLNAIFVQSASSAENAGIPTFYGALRPIGVELPNTIASLELTCNGTVIDTVSWGPTWPGSSGVSMQLDRNRTDFTLNDAETNWCPAPFSYGSQVLLGSPGATNATCP